MPKYARPQQTPEIERVSAVLGGNAARLAVLSAIAQNPRATASQIVDLTGLALGTVRIHLGNLVRDNLVESDPPATLSFKERSGKVAYYTVRTHELVDTVRELATMLGVLDELRAEDVNPQHRDEPLIK